MRGGEKCLQAMCQVFPQADIFTLVYYPENFSGEFENHRIITSFIQKLPGNARTFRRWLSFFPKAMESFDLSGYDLVLSFSHCVAKGVKVPSGIPHICYCHTPMRYAWDMRDDYIYGMNPLKRKAVSMLLDHLQKWDRSVSSRVDHFITNSQHVRHRIGGRECHRCVRPGNSDDAVEGPAHATRPRQGCRAVRQELARRPVKKRAARRPLSTSDAVPGDRE